MHNDMEWKRIKILLLFLSLVFVSCNNISDFNEEDVKRHPWLYDFIQDIPIIEGTHNFTYGTIELVLQIDTIEQFFLKTDLLAKKEYWMVNDYELKYRVYSKELKSIGGDGHLVIIRMEFRDPDLLQITIY